MSKRKCTAGRPPLPPELKRVSKSIRMTKAEWKQAKQLAQAQGVSVNELIRRLVCGAVVP